MKKKRDVYTPKGYYEAIEEFIKEKKLLAREICTQKTATRIKKSRQPKNIGRTTKLSDEQALYLRKESRIRSVSSLCKELDIDRSTAYNCIKGITYKHLDAIEKPQL